MNWEIRQWHVTVFFGGDKEVPDGWEPFAAHQLKSEGYVVWLRRPMPEPVVEGEK